VTSRTNRIDLDPILEVIVEKLAERIRVSHADRPAWRTLAAEAASRGFPSARALRDWCAKHRVTVRGSGKHQIIDVAELDAAISKVPPTPRRERAPIEDDEAILARAGLRIVKKGRADDGAQADRLAQVRWEGVDREAHARWRPPSSHLSPRGDDARRSDSE
jgi:hypothetical protein